MTTSEPRQVLFCNEITLLQTIVCNSEGIGANKGELTRVFHRRTRGEDSSLFAFDKASVP